MVGRQWMIVVRQGQTPALRAMGPLGAVARTLTTVVLAAAGIAVLLLLVLVTLLTAGMAATAIGGVAYWKRDQWTRPAYRWVKDRSGRWRVTPWSGDAGTPSFGDARVPPQ